MTTQTGTLPNHRPSLVEATKHALEHYFGQLAEGYLSTPPLRRITPEKLRNDILRSLLIKTHEEVGVLVRDKRTFNSIFRKVFMHLINKAWYDFPRKGR